MSPRTREQNEEIRRERIRQIMHAALTVYLANGFRGSEIGDVAKQAGIARGLVYHYFKDKHELFRALFEHSLEDVQTFMTSLLNTGEPPLTRLEQYMRKFLGSALERPYMVGFFTSLYNDIPLVFEEQAEAYRDRFHHVLFDPLTAAMAEGIQQQQVVGMNPQLLAQVFWGAMNGAVNGLLPARETADLQKQVDDAVRIALRAIRGDTEKRDIQ